MPKFNHRELPPLGFHFSSERPHEVKDYYHGHAYMIVPKEMTRKEFDGALEWILKRKPTPGTHAVVFLVSSPTLRDSKQNDPSRPIKRGEFQIIKLKEIGGWREGMLPPRIQERVDAGLLDIHLGDIVSHRSRDMGLLKNAWSKRTERDRGGIADPRVEALFKDKYMATLRKRRLMKLLSAHIGGIK
jgi:hypothetical protein